MVNRKIQCNRNYVYSFFDIFIFRIVLTKKYKSMKAIEDEFKQAQCITEVAARSSFVRRLLLKHFN